MGLKCVTEFSEKHLRQSIHLFATTFCAQANENNILTHISVYLVRGHLAGLPADTQI